MYDLRRACWTEWLNEAIPPAQAAAWAGNSVTAVVCTYAKVIDGRRAELLAPLSGALRVAEPPAAADPPD